MNVRIRLLRRHLENTTIVFGRDLQFGIFTGCGGSSSPPLAPTPDFAIFVSPPLVSAQVGGTTAPVTVSLNSLNGFTGPVTVTLSGFPNGINTAPQLPFTLSPGATHQVTFFCAGRRRSGLARGT